jgi:hypothetical protein
MTALYDMTPPVGLIALYGVLLAWSIAAYLTACVTGLRALSSARDGAPPRPFCLVVDSTRWVFGRRLSASAWTARDFIRLGIFTTVLASIIRAALLGEQAFDLSLTKPPTPFMIRSALLHVLSGSALIVLHCGLALHFQKERQP